MLNPNVIKLDNGLTVVMDYLPSVETATVGVWSNIGSRVEIPENNGICHFLEHMVFKGTKTRTSLMISEYLENKGGHINAWTSKEKTAWYAKVMKEDINLAIDILFDIIRNSTFPSEELEKEKGVIIEEMKMYQDDPSDVVYNLYEKICYAGHSLAYPIIGIEKNIKNFTRETFTNHLKQYYYPSKMVIVISGNFKENEFIDMVQQQTNNWIDVPVDINHGKPIVNANKEVMVKKEIEQTAMIYGLQAISYTNEDYYKYSIANSILGVGMSSRLFAEIREKRGLAYHISSFLNSYLDCGTLAIQVGCSHDNAKLVVELIKEEINKLTINIEDIELTRAKNLLKSSLLMSLESTYARGNRLASNILNFGTIKDMQQLIIDINNVDKQTIINIFKSLITAPEITAALTNKDLKI